MRQSGQQQISFNSGEISPEVWDRSDTKQYYSAAAVMTNFEPVAQGGVRVMPRSRDVGGVRAGVFAIAAPSATLTLGPHTGPAVLAQTTFTNGASALACVYVYAFKSTVAESDVLVVEYRDAADSQWKALSASFDVETSFRNRIAARPPLSPVQATAVRLRYTGSSTVTFNLTSINPVYDTAGQVACRVRDFSFSEDQVYTIVYTPLFADVWRNGVHVGAFSHGFSAAQLGHVRLVNRFDTLIMFHDELATLKVVRQGADHEWDWQNLVFKNIPKVDYGAVYTRVANIWQLHLRWPAAGSIISTSLSFNVDGADTNALFITEVSGSPGTPNWSAFSSTIIAALEGLSEVGTGIAVSITQAGSLATIQVTFSGDDNIGQGFAISGKVLNNPEASLTASQTQRADMGGEPLISESRGYASCGIFYQDRLVTAGFKSRLSGVLFSPTADYFDGTITINADSGGILLALNTDVVERIHTMVNARHLMMFTSDAEYYVSDRAIKRTQPVNIPESSRNGSARSIPILKNNNTVLYVARNRALLYSASYSDIDQAYVSTPLSRLASHLVRDVVDAALQRPTEYKDAPRHFMPLGNGEMTVGFYIEEEEVKAFCRWKTDGKVLSVCADYANEVYLLVERQIGGAPQVRLEKLERTLLFDQAVTLTGSARTVVTGLSVLEGAQVWAQSDAGWIEGPFTVSSGQITVPFPVTTVTVGRWTPPLLRTLPRVKNKEGTAIVDRPVRVVSVLARVLDTTSIAFRANLRLDGSDRAPISALEFRAGDAPDVPLVPVSEDVLVEGFSGYTDEGFVEVTQVRPGALHLRSLLLETK